MKFIGVLICTLCVVSLWGGADPVKNEAPLNFQLICPNDVVVDCEEDLRNLSKWGDAYVLKDYKRISAGSPTIVDERNGCGIGIITRTWKVEDINWKWHTCSQIIEVNGGGNFTYSDITWPENYTVDTCHINVHPGNLPDEFGYPKFKNKKCSMVAYSYKDEVFNFSPTCQKIIRRWKILDWCTFVPGGRSGIFERAQVIKIEKGKGKPKLECPKDTIIRAENCDSADVDLDDLFAVSSCGDSLRVFNNSQYADSRVGDASGTYPIGEHTFYYYVEYGCARELKCYVTIKVIDAKPPTPYCKNGIITTLMPIDTNNDGSIDGGMQEVWASDLNAGSYHDCDPDRKLTYSFSSDTTDKVINFTCDSLGKNVVEIWVTDEFGNQSFCITYILVQNNNPRLVDCEPDSLKGGTIKGLVLVSSGLKIKNVHMDLIGHDATYSISQRIDTILLPSGDTNFVSVDDTSWHDLNVDMMADKGEYQFTKLPMHKHYTLMAERTDDMLNGVDVWDFYTLMFHLNGMYEITDPLLKLAADLNNDGKINHFDEYLLINAIMNPKDVQFQFKSWTFFEKNRLNDWVQNSGWPLLQEKAFYMTDLTEKFNDVMWTGIKMGDFDSSVNPNISLPDKKVINLRGSRHGIWERNLKFQNTWTIRLNPSIVAGDVLISISPDDIQSIDTEGEVHIHHRRDGVRVLWTQGMEAAKAINFNFKAGIDMSIPPQFDDLINVVYDESGRSSRLQLKNMEEGSEEKMTVLHVFPNPATGIIQIEWENIEEGETHFQIFNSVGQKVLENYKGSFGRGIALTHIDIEEVKSSGTFFFKITQGDHYCIGSFVKL